jgi:DNA-binding winged helix-turn-helix (wHTH) protein/tetratricopeptide (TPR) repeat protein
MEDALAEVGKSLAVRSPVYDFGEFRIDPGKRVLLRSGVQIPLPPKAFDTLMLLVTHRGRVLDKQQVMRAIWPDTIVEENNLNQNISTLRRVLGDARGENRYIATIPGRGYCFTAEVRLVSPAGGGERAGHLRIAVLPFDNIGGGPEREYLVDGLTEETISAIGQIDPERLSVIGRTSVMAYKRTNKSLAEIGHELDATHLMEGSLRAEGDRLRITAKLIQVLDQSQIWSSSYDGEPQSILSFQCELSQAIAEQVRLRLSPARLHALTTRQPRNLEAYDLYLRGRFFWNQFTAGSTRRAMEFYTRATALDPEYALAWSGLADACSSSPITGDVPPLQIVQRARDAAEHAVRADAGLAEAQTSLGFFQFWLGWDWIAAEAAFRVALKTDPNYAFAHRMLGILLSHCCRHAEAAAAIHRACELDPLNPMNRALSSQVAFAGRDLPAAIRFAREAIVLDPEFWIGYLQLAQAYVETGRNEEALDALNQTSRWSSGNSKALSLRGYLLGRKQRRSEALEVLATLEAIGRERYLPPYAMALVQLGLGEVERALDGLEQSLAVRDVHLAFLTMDPKWDPLRQHSRFRQLMDRCGFAGAVLQSR